MLLGPLTSKGYSVMQEECHSEPSIRVSEQCMEGRRFPLATQIFSLSHACGLLNISSFLFHDRD